MRIITRAVKNSAALALIASALTVSQVVFSVAEADHNIHVPWELSLKSEIDSMNEAYNSEREISEPEDSEEDIDPVLAGIDRAQQPMACTPKPVTVRTWFPFFFIYIGHSRTGVEVSFNNAPPGFPPEAWYIPIPEIPDNGNILYQYIGISNCVRTKSFLCNKGILTGSAVFYTEKLGSIGDYALFRDPQRERKFTDINSMDGIIMMELQMNKLYFLLEGNTDVIILNEYLLLKKNVCADLAGSIDGPENLMEELEKRDSKNILVVEIEGLKNALEPESPV